MILCFAMKQKFYEPLFGDQIFSFGDWKKIQSPLGACIKHLISDPVYIDLLNSFLLNIV